MVGALKYTGLHGLESLYFVYRQIKNTINDKRPIYAMIT